jgi:hypothetical protein
MSRINADNTIQIIQQCAFNHEITKGISISFHYKYIYQNLNNNSELYIKAPIIL